MSTSPNKRNVSRGISTRKVGAAPDIGHVTRMYDSKQGERRRSRSGRRGKQYRARRLFVLAWSVVIFLATAGVLAAAFVFWLRPMLNRSKDTTERDRTAKEASIRKAGVSEYLSREATQAAVDKAMAVSNAAEVSAAFRPASVSPERVAEYMVTWRRDQGKPALTEWLPGNDKNNLQLEGLLLGYGDRMAPEPRLALLTPDSQDVWKMDFDAFARTCNPPWPEIMEDGPGRRTPLTAEVRVCVKWERSPYYNGPFADEKSWLAIGIANPGDLLEPLTGYCRRGSAQALALVSIIKNFQGAGIPRATLRIYRPAEASLKQFEIKRVLAEDWVTSDKAFDESRDWTKIPDADGPRP